MYKLLPLSIGSPYVLSVCKLLTKYGGLIFSEIENPVGSFLDSFIKGDIKVIVALENDKFIAFIAFYNFKMVSQNRFSCYMYGASERKASRALNILLPILFEDLKRQGCIVVRCETRIYNMPMRMLAKRLNFRKVGILKRACFDNAEFIDNILYEKIL